MAARTGGRSTDSKIVDDRTSLRLATRQEPREDHSCAARNEVDPRS